MSKIEKRIVVSSDMSNRVKNMGSVIPSWYPDYTNINNWYWTSENEEPRIAFYYNIVGDDTFIQYGKDAQGWARATFFGQTVEIVEEEELENGSIKVTLRVKANFFNGQRNNQGVAGYPVEYYIRINNVLQYTFKGNTIDSFSNGPRPYQEITTIVKPQQTSSIAALKMEIKYPTGIWEDRELIVGVGLYNPNPETYIPMAIRKGNNWKDLDRNKGKIQRRIGGSWKDFSNENINTIRQENKGKNRIRKSNKWYQLPFMRNDKV